MDVDYNDKNNGDGGCGDKDQNKNYMILYMIIISCYIIEYIIQISN